MGQSWLLKSRAARDEMIHRGCTTWREGVHEGNTAEISNRNGLWDDWCRLEPSHFWDRILERSICMSHCCNWIPWSNQNKVFGCSSGLFFRTCLKNNDLSVDESIIFLNDAMWISYDFYTKQRYEMAHIVLVVILEVKELTVRLKTSGKVAQCTVWLAHTLVLSIKNDVFSRSSWL